MRGRGFLGGGARRVPEYRNVLVTLEGSVEGRSIKGTYRVAFHRGGHAMLVARKMAKGERVIDIGGPTAQAVVAMARQLEASGVTLATR